VLVLWRAPAAVPQHGLGAARCCGARCRPDNLGGIAHARVHGEALARRPGLCPWGGTVAGAPHRTWLGGFLEKVFGLWGSRAWTAPPALP
jgi:hypothetical protein